MNSYFSLIIWSDDRHRPEVFSWDFHCALEMMLEEDWRETMADVRYFRTEENCYRSDWEDRLSMVEIDWQKHLMDNDYQGVNLDVLPPDEMTRWKEHGFCFFFSSRIWYLPVMMFVQVDGVLMTMVLVVVVEWWQVNLLEWCSTEYQERCEKRCHCRCCKQVENWIFLDDCWLKSMVNQVEKCEFLVRSICWKSVMRRNEFRIDWVMHEMQL